MSLLFDENLLTLQSAAASLPGRPHISTLHRWRLRGVRGVQLETCLIGGTRYTSCEALQRFVEATTIAATSSRHGPAELERLTVAGPIQRHVSQRRKAASDYLDRAGV